MADIRIVREHALGLATARRLAQRWVEVARQKLQMDCHLVAGEEGDVVRFRRTGVHGELRVSATRFELGTHLGFLLGMFRHRIEAEIVRNLDQLLASEDPLQAFEQGLARHEARHGAHHHPHAPGKRPARGEAD